MVSIPKPKQKIDILYPLILILSSFLFNYYRKDGYLFDKEALLEYILTKKREYARQLKEYEKQKRKEEVCKLYFDCNFPS